MFDVCCVLSKLALIMDAVMRKCIREFYTSPGFVVEKQIVTNMSILREMYLCLNRGGASLSRDI
jgi:hypothetical protein